MRPAKVAVQSQCRASHLLSRRLRPILAQISGRKRTRGIAASSSGELGRQVGDKKLICVYRLYRVSRILPPRTATRAQSPCIDTVLTLNVLGISTVFQRYYNGISTVSQYHKRQKRHRKRQGRQGGDRGAARAAGAGGGMGLRGRWGRWGRVWRITGLMSTRWHL